MNHFYHNKTVLVTGGAGFIGSHLVEKLVDYGAHVTVIDNLSTGLQENIAAVIHDINFIQADITDYTACLYATRAQEIIFHLAAWVSVADCLQHPTQCYNNNVIGTVNILQAAMQQRCKRIIFASSAAVYGTQQEPCHETMECKPESPYGHSKLIGELLCKQFSTHSSTEAVILRYFNVYGERQRVTKNYASFVAHCTEQLRTGQPITILGDGLQTRDFVPVEEIIHANIVAGCAPSNYIANKIFNVASGKSITLLAMLEQLKQRYPDYNLPYRFLPAYTGDITHSEANISLYEQLKRTLNGTNTNTIRTHKEG